MNNVIKKLLERANLGDSQASYKLGLYFETGNFVEQDYEKAMQWYITAIKQDENIQASERLKILQQKDIELRQALLNTKRKIIGIVYPYLGRFVGNTISANRIKRCCYQRAVKNGNSKTLCKLAILYINGIGVKKNTKKAKEFLLMANEKGYKESLLILGWLSYLEKDYKLAQMYWLQATEEKKILGKAFEYLGNLHLYGLGVEQDYKKAKEYFEKALENGNDEVLYNINTFNKIGSKKIKEIENIAEFQEVEDNIGGVLIHPKYNLVLVGNSLYDIETFCEIKKRINELLKGIPEVLEDKSNECDVFKQICKTIADNYSYDNIYYYSELFKDILNMIIDSSVFKTNKQSEKIFTSRNLIGVLNNSGGCVFFSELLRNMCACRNIECINVYSQTKEDESHTFVFVKIQGTWYPFDMTWMRKKIKNGYEVENMLVSQKEFERYDYHLPNDYQYIPKEGLATTSYNTQALVKNALQSGVSNNMVIEAQIYLKALIKRIRNITSKSKGI